ncbi:MAG: large subunit ribosomal protein [Campylobacterota bacterium]|nr:large subunit ribosomal protein [Campylobacterota bacterium]
MTKAQKAEVIDFLTSSFKETEAIAICDYKGLTVKQLETLRNRVRVVGGNTKVVKNTLANIALKNAGKDGYELSETNVLVWGNDQLQIAKIVAKFASENKELFVIRQAYIDGSFKNAEEIVALSKLPGREELLGMLLSTWTAPIRMFVTGLDNLSKKNEAQSA